MQLMWLLYWSILLVSCPWSSWGQKDEATSNRGGGRGNQDVLWALTRTMHAGEIIKMEDMTPQPRGNLHVPGAVGAPSEILGMQAARRLHAGTVVTKDQWKDIPVIKKGQGVRIVLETPHLRIVAPGESLQDGRAGERIRILNLSSRQSVSARVQDAKTVVVDF